MSKNSSIDFAIHNHKIKDIPKGSVIAAIGPRGSGKSVAVKEMCYRFRDIPQFTVVSKTERNNGFFSDFICPRGIHYDWDPMLIQRIFGLQDTLIQKYGKDDPRTHSVLILDDCLCDKKIWKDPGIVELLMNGRHRNITFIFTLQYPIGISPELRSNIDFIYIYSQESNKDKQKIYDHYAGVFENPRQFRSVFDSITEDYRCMVINRKNKSNKVLDKIFWFKARTDIPKFKAGHPIFWEPVKELKSVSDNNKAGISVRLLDT